MKKSIYIVLILILMSSVLMTFNYFRYEIVPTGGDYGYAYKIDRLTGEITILAQGKEHNLDELK